MLDKLEKIREEGFQRIAEAADMDSLEAVRRELTGKKSALQEVLKSLGGIDPEMRKSVGMKANEVKNSFAEKLQEKADELIAGASAVDVLCTGRGDFSEFSLPWVENPVSTHGTGCSLAAALAAELALGRSVKDAVRGAKAYVHDAIAGSYLVGPGCGVLGFAPRRGD